MLVYLDRLISETGDGDSTTTTTTNNKDESAVEKTNSGNLTVELRNHNLLHCLVDPTSSSTSYSTDFGRIYQSHPAAVLRPTTTDEVVRSIHLCRSSPHLTLSPRGNAHSISGQTMPLDTSNGLVLDLSGLTNIEILPDDNRSAWVGAGAMWEDVLVSTIDTCKMTPRSWVDYLGLTVGGTLSNGGVSGQAFKFGPQTENVLELEVVTGNADVISCSETKNENLFSGVLGGLGQFGVITRARIPLYPSPQMVRWMRFVYSEFEDYRADVELLVCREEVTFDYIEGFVFVNSDDPVNGYASVPLSVHHRFDPDRIPPGSGPVLYCLEVGLHYTTAGENDLIEKKVEEFVRGSRHVPGLDFSTDVSYVEFLTRVKTAEEAAKANGTWDAPHPWLNLFVSSADIADFDLNVFKKILRNGIGGPMLVYPLVKSMWDPRKSVAVPESEIFYLVALLRFSRPFPDGPPVEKLMAQNQEIINHCVSNGYDFKVYIPRYQDEDQWKRHFGKDWSRFVEMKSHFDPTAILTPGQRIFQRVQNALQ